MRKIILTMLMLTLTLAFLGCQPQTNSVELVYVEWATEVASTNVVRAILQEEMGYDVKITPVSAAAMWQSVATGDADGMVAAWLPTTHADYLAQTQDQLEVLGPNLEGTRIGLVVPSYVEIDSIPQLAQNAERFNGRIVGIDPGAGIMQKTEVAMEVYELENQVDLVEGSGATMTAALADAIRNKEWIAVTGWTPHWKFAKWDLKYLEDPKNVYGGEEYIATAVRSGLKEDMPRGHALLDNFQWSPEDMQQVMVWNQGEDVDPYESAVKWIKQNQEKVKSWIPPEQ